jgi:predicted transcriptional regulator
MDVAVGVAAARRAGRASARDGRAAKILSEEVFRGLVETTLSRVVFRNMASEDRSGEEQTGEEQIGEEQTGENRADDDPAGQDQDQPRPRDDRLQLDLTDPKAMRALAHPLRWALLEALSHAGTLTATQASEMLGESPANCAFHLRTLAKYGFVEEAGGGKGRARPWRASSLGFSFASSHDDPERDVAANALVHLLRERQLGRYREWLETRATYPREWRDAAGNSEYLCYLTVDELERLNADLAALLADRFVERLKDPAHRPEGSVPVEVLLFSYPLRPPARPG